MSMIRDLSTFIMETASEGDRQKISNLLGNFAGKALGNQDVQGGVKDLLSDEDGLATLLAYILKYMDTYEVDAADINELLRTLGINLDELISEKLNGAEKSISRVIAQAIPSMQSLNIAAEDLEALTIDVSGEALIRAVLALVHGQLSYREQAPVLVEINRILNGVNPSAPAVQKIENLLDLVEKKYKALPDVDVASLNSGSKKLGEVMSAVQSGEIKVNYNSFVLTYNLLRKKADDMEEEYRKLQNALDYLTEDWIGEDQKAFVQAGANLQKELGNRIQEVRDMADKLEEASEAFRTEDLLISEFFTEDARNYNLNFQKAQEAVTELGG